MRFLVHLISCLFTSLLPHKFDILARASRFFNQFVHRFTDSKIQLSSEPTLQRFLATAKVFFFKYLNYENVSSRYVVLFEIDQQF